AATAPGRSGAGAGPGALPRAAAPGPFAHLLLLQEHPRRPELLAGRRALPGRAFRHAVQPRNLSPMLPDHHRTSARGSSGPSAGTEPDRVAMPEPSPTPNEHSMSRLLTFSSYPGTHTAGARGSRSDHGAAPRHFVDELLETWIVLPEEWEKRGPDLHDAVRR